MSEGNKNGIVVGAIEIYPASSFPTNSREKAVLNSRNIIEKNKITPLDKYAIDLEDERLKRYKEMQTAIIDNVIKTYLYAGIEIPNNKMPKINIYNNGEPEVRRREKRQIGFSGNLSNRVDLYPNGGPDGFLNNIILLHHEVNHHFGRQIGVLILDKIKHPFFKKIIPIQKERTVNAQMGFANVYNIKKVRGLFLEEGFVTYLSHEFILTSNNKVITDARLDFAKSVNDKINDRTDDYEIKQTCKKSIESNQPKTYRYASLLIDTLIEGARKVGEDEAIEMRKDLIRTRVDTKNTRSLMNRIDRIFGQGTTSQIYKMKFEKIKNGENLIFINGLN